MKTFEWLNRINVFSAKSQCYRILNRMRKGPVTNDELVRRMGIFNYNGRIHDIRNKGFVVHSHHIENGLWQYSLSDLPF